MPVSFPIPLAEEVSFWKAIAPQGDKGSFLWWQMTHQIPWFKNFANESNEKAWDWRGGEVKKRVEAEAQGSMLDLSTLSTPSAGEQVREIRWLRERWGWKKKHDNEATRITWNKRWVRSNWISNFFVLFSASCQTTIEVKVEVIIPLETTITMEQVMDQLE